MPRRRIRETGQLARDSAIPLYYQLATRLEGELAAGRFAAAARYYSDRELVARWGISLLTVRQAMDELVNKGLLERQRGSGTFVSAKGAALAGPASAGREALLFAGWGLAALTS